MNIDNSEVFYPSNIEIKYSYIKIDNRYVVSLLLLDYPRELSFRQIIEALPKRIENTTSFTIKKLNSLEEIKKLTSLISICKSEKSTIGKNQLDIDIIDNIISSAIELRRKVQVENEEIYNLSIYITISNENLQQLFIDVKNIQDILYSKGIIAKVGNFRQKQLYLSSIPICCVDKYLYEHSSKMVTSSLLAYNFPYYTTNVMMEKGIIYGYTQNSFLMYDIFCKNNTNSNMCVLGSSGSGKSYFIKMLIIRNVLIGTKQVIIDPEGEYVDIVNKMGGYVITIENFNPLYIHENYVQNNFGSVIGSKVSRIINNTIMLDSSIDNAGTTEILKDMLTELYNEKNMYNNQESFYNCGDENSIYITREYKKNNDFPTVDDLLEKTETNKDIKKYEKKKLIENNYIKLFNKNHERNSKRTTKQLEPENNMMKCGASVICFDLKGLKAKEIPGYVYTSLDYIEEMYGEKILVYIDEMWKCIVGEEKELVSTKIKEMFKTIRKKNAGIVVITQDINDFFKYQNGDFGKSVLNNSYTKVIFKMEYADFEILKNIGIDKFNIAKDVRALHKGESIFNIEDTYCVMKVKANKRENELIEGVKNEKGISSGR